MNRPLLPIFVANKASDPRRLQIRLVEASVLCPANSSFGPQFGKPQISSVILSWTTYPGYKQGKTFFFSHSGSWGELSNQNFRFSGYRQRTNPVLSYSVDWYQARPRYWSPAIDGIFRLRLKISKPCRHRLIDPWHPQRTHSQLTVNHCLVSTGTMSKCHLGTSHLSSSIPTNTCLSTIPPPLSSYTLSNCRVMFS